MTKNEKKKQELIYIKCKYHKIKKINSFNLFKKNVNKFMAKLLEL